MSPVYDELRARILSGALPPGEQVPTDALAAEFGCGPGPVREALGQLAREGLLEIRDDVSRVRPLHPQHVLDLYEVRTALERAAARAAAARRTDDDLRHLSATVRAMHALDEREVGQRPGLAHALHFDVWRASHNGTLVDTLQSVHVRVMALSSTTLHHASRWARFREESAALLDAIRDRDARRAGDVIEAQMTGARDFRLHLYTG